LSSGLGCKELVWDGACSLLRKDKGYASSSNDFSSNDCQENDKTSLDMGTEGKILATG